MKVGVASVKGTYKGKVAIKDKQAPCALRLERRRLGRAGLHAGRRGRSISKRAMVRRCSSTAPTPKIGGLIASVGQRMLNGVAKMMAEQFFKKVESFV